jgi:uncharacterized membrane protein
MHPPENPPENPPQEPGQEPETTAAQGSEAAPEAASVPAPASAPVPAPVPAAGEIGGPSAPADMLAPTKTTEMDAPSADMLAPATTAEMDVPSAPADETAPAQTDPGLTGAPSTPADLAAPSAPADVPPPDAPPADAGPNEKPEPWWPRLALPVGTLMTAGYSIVLGVQMVALKSASRQELLLNNVFGSSGARGRRVVLLTLAVGALIPLLAAAAVAIWKRARSVELMDRVGRLLGPLIFAAALPALFTAPFTAKNALPYLAVLSLVALGLPPLLERSFEAAGEIRRGARRELPFRSLKIPNWVYFAIVFAAASGYAAYFGYYTLLMHKKLLTSGFDLGIYDNLMYNALRGHPFESPVLFGPRGGSYIAGHAEFAMLLFVPIYAIAPGPENLLIVQAVLLGFAAVPLYLFAATQISRPASVIVALAYLFFAPLHGPNFYDFHWLPIAIFFHFWLYYGIATKRSWLIALMVVILFAIREDVAVGTAVLGLFLLLTRLRPRLGVALMVLSTAWFALVRFYIMPKAGEWFFHQLYKQLFADGDPSFTSVIRTILTNPVYFVSTLLKETKLVFALHMLAPLAFIPCRRVPLLLLLLPGFFFTLMTTEYAPTVSIAFQYTTHWIPYLFLGIVLALVLMDREPKGALAKRAALATMALCVFSHSYNFGAVLERSNFIGGFSRIPFTVTPEELARYKDLKELTAMIPQSAQVAATDPEVPHVSTRRVTYHIHGSIGAAEYMLIFKSHINGKSRGPISKLLAEKQWGLVARRGDELFLFKKGHVSPETREAKRALGFPEK